MLLAMFKIRGTDRPLLAQVSDFRGNTNALTPSLTTLANIESGSGCMAALEAEKFLAEHEDAATSGAPEMQWGN